MAVIGHGWRKHISKRISRRFIMHIPFAGAFAIGACQQGAGNTPQQRNRARRIIARHTFLQAREQAMARIGEEFLGRQQPGELFVNHVAVSLAAGPGLGAMGQITPGIIPAGMDCDETVNLDGFGGHGVSFLVCLSRLWAPAYWIIDLLQMSPALMMKAGS